MRHAIALSLLSLVSFWSLAQETQPAMEILDPNMAVKDADSGLLWYDVLDLGLEGQAWTDTETPYDRLPARVKDAVRDPVWRLSTHTAGLYVRFVTDAPAISARWTARYDSLAMDHMPATGVSGLDLYMRHDSVWRWVAVGRPKAVENEQALIEGLPDGAHEFMLYLPLYNGVTNVQLGLPEGATLGKAPAWPNPRPIVVYGTSITQGGCAARAGMAYPSILSRSMDRPFINLGFSGNGKMETPIVDLIAGLDPAVYVIDCTPNMSPEEVTERTAPLAHTLRAARPDTPIVFVECIMPRNGWVTEARAAYANPKNDALKAEFDKLVAGGMTGLHYVPADNLLGPESETESTVDGVHPTDIGFRYYADALEPLLRELTE